MNSENPLRSFASQLSGLLGLIFESANMKKPTGKIGPFKVSVDDKRDIIGCYEKISFPKIKDEIEEYIVQRFIFSANKELEKTGEKFIISNPTKNELDDFDFNVTSPKGGAYLELMEAAPLKRVKGGYEKAPPEYRPYSLASNIFEKILSKSNKYPENLSRDLFLLVYVTHWTFVFNETTVAYLRYFCANSRLKFNGIFSYSPLDYEFGTVRWIYPVSPDLINGFDPEKYKDYVVINLDVAKSELFTENKS